MNRLLFLDGIGCNPDGFKPRFLRDSGYDVTAPLLPDLDFDASVAIANEALAETAPDVVIGYSRGGGIAMLLDDRVTPRLLIAPSLSRLDDGCGFDGRLVILNSATDDSLPLEQLHEHLFRCNLKDAELHVVGEDHSMIDTAALSTLTKMLTDLTGG